MSGRLRWRQMPRSRRVQRFWPLALSLLGACSRHAQRPPVNQLPAPVAPALSSKPPEETPAELAVLSWPWIGFRAEVRVRIEGATRVLDVTRMVPDGVVASWRVRFKSTGVRVLDEVVDELAASSGVEKSCPWRLGRDGVSWVVNVPAKHLLYGRSFRMPGGGPECARFDATVTRLMTLARLECDGAKCVRPDEIASGRLTCAAGDHGAECRENAEGRFSLSPRFLRELDE